VTPEHEGTDGIEITTGNRPRDMDACLFSAVHQIPLGLAIPGVEHYTIMPLKVRRFDGQLSVFHPRPDRGRHS